MISNRLDASLQRSRSGRSWPIALLITALLLQSASAGVKSVRRLSAPAPVETGKFRLHKFQQAIGEETYEVSRDGDDLVMKTDFRFTDRGSPVPLSSTLRTRQDLTPIHF